MERARAQSCPKNSSGTEGRQVSLGRGACPLAKVNSMEEHSLGVGGVATTEIKKKNQSVGWLACLTFKLPSFPPLTLPAEWVSFPSKAEERSIFSEEIRKSACKRPGPTDLISFLYLDIGASGHWRCCCLFPTLTP